MFVDPRQENALKLQALGSMDGHQADAIGILFEHGRFGGFFFLCLRR